MEEIINFVIRSVFYGQLFDYLSYFAGKSHRNGSPGSGYSYPLRLFYPGTAGLA
jgi:hypothetical protein